MSRRKARTVRQRGLALVLALGAVAAVFVVGMAILNGLPASTKVSSNLVDHTRAVYLAECGLVEALYHMEHPPVGDEVWSGITGRALDKSGATYDITVTSLGDDDYRVAATAHVPCDGGNTIAQSRSMDVHLDMQSSGYPWTMSAILGGNTTVTTTARIDGDLHVNGGLLLMGEVTGDVTATDYIINFGGQAGSVSANADTMDEPQIDFDAYGSYSYRGVAGKAMVVSSGKVGDLSTTVAPITAENPLGVVVVTGPMWLSKDLHIDGGILVVQGDVDVNQYDLKVDGIQGQFSLLINGRLLLGNGASVEVSDGPAYLKGSILTDYGAYNMRLEFDGGLVAHEGLPFWFNGTIRVRNQPFNDGGVSSAAYFGDSAGSERTLTVLSYSPEK